MGVTRSNDNPEKIKRILYLLEAVAGEKLKPEAGLAQWPEIDSETDELLSASWHDLSHYANDDHIRSKDEEYAAYQRNLLLERASEIRAKYGRS